MKKLYETPVTEWLLLSSIDVIATSGNQGAGNGNELPDVDNPFA